VSLKGCIITQMLISQEALERFKAMYKKEYGINLSDDEAREKAKTLMSAKEVVEKTKQD